MAAFVRMGRFFDPEGSGFGAGKRRNLLTQFFMDE
jgi:hypothetical protein